MRRAISAALVVLALVSLAGAQSYTVTDLGSRTPLAINDHGQVAGSDQGIASIWTSATGWHQLGSLGGGSGAATAISNLLQVAGYSNTPSASVHAFFWTPGGGMQDLGTLGGSQSSASGINDSGQVVGAAFLTGDTLSHAFLWTSTGGMQDLGTLGGNVSGATAINKNGQVAGYSFLADNVTAHAFLWTQAGGMQDLGTLGGTNSGANGVNSLGAVTGDADSSSNSNEVAFLWTQSHGMRGLGTLSLDSIALGINGLGQVVGYTQGVSAQQGFLWSQAHGMQNLNSLVSGWVIQSATSINRSGQITAIGFQNSCRTCLHALLLTPTAKSSDQAALRSQAAKTSAARR